MSEWWRGGVTYQIYPRSFQDTNGDGSGDLRGITERLGHVAQLGVDAIWLSPIFPSPMADTGYDVSDYTDIASLFGTLADFDAMVAKAHALGLKVIIDQVLSHSSIAHPFFAESRTDRSNPKADWYVWADPRHDGTPPNNWLSIFGGPAWAWEPRRRQYYLHNFLAEQPDFNFHNPEVQDWLLGTLRFWLDRGVDGFRLDTVNFYFHDAKLRDNPADYRRGEKLHWNPAEMQYPIFSKNQPENLDFMERLRAVVDDYPDRVLIGEMGETHHPIRMMGDYTSGRRLHQCYSFEMMLDDFNAGHFRSKVEDFFAGAPQGWPAWAFSNHDVVRHVSRWAAHGTDPDSLAKLACALLLSLEGSICLFQGEELGQIESDLDYEELVDPQGLRFWPDNKGRDGCRTPMVWDAEAPNAGFSTAAPWLPVKAPQAARAAAQQERQADSVLAFYREMLALRRSRAALRTGRSVFFDVAEPVLAFARGGEMLCLFNLSREARLIGVRGLGPAALARGIEAEGEVLRLGPGGFGIFDLAGAPEVADLPEQPQVLAGADI